MVTPKKKQFYVDKKKLYDAMVMYKSSVEEARKTGQTKPRIPEEVGAAIYLIAQRLATSSNYNGYSYIDEMISDGVENCLLYIDNFEPFSKTDPTKMNNAFAYFTTIINYAFIRRIQTEKRLQYMKYKAAQHQQLTNQLIDNSFVPEDNPVINEFIKNFEEKMSQKKKKTVVKTSTNNLIGLIERNEVPANTSCG